MISVKPFREEHYFMSAVSDRPEPEFTRNSDLSQELPCSSKDRSQNFRFISHLSHETQSDEPLSAEIQPDELIIHHNSTPTRAILSPQDIKPFLKAAPRKSSNRGREKGRTIILTDTPEKEAIEGAARMAVLKEIPSRRPESVCKRNARKQLPTKPSMKVIVNSHH
ncbi:hypothetical protein JTB14_018163 [Gonioctena quinquepunctata]|nr:hypothetical protein JTB14_018163 [Gonioctena quinquepunctata]